MAHTTHLIAPTVHPSFEVAYRVRVARYWYGTYARNSASSVARLYVPATRTGRLLDRQ